MINVNVVKLIRRIELALKIINIGFVFEDNLVKTGTMKLFYVFLSVVLVVSSCQKNEVSNCEGEVYRGKLVVKGICMNYVIQLLDGDLNEDFYEKNWVNEFTSETYQNVFALETVCSFPLTIEEGEEFNFILEEESELCHVCKAYSPTPSKRLSIKICPI